MQIDEVINKINGKDTFKVIAFLILSLPTFQNYGQMQSILLATITPNHTCQYNSSFINITPSNNQCFVSKNGVFEKCVKWNFSYEPVGITMMSDFKLVCEKRNFGDLILVVWYLTSFTAILMGWLSDKYGRKKIAILNLSIETVSSICLSFAPDLASMMICRIFIGISSCSIFITFVWLIESVDVEFRKFVGSFFWIFGCAAYMIFPGIVYATKNWRYTQLLSVTFNVLYISIIFFPESPRWLFVMGKKREAYASLQKICKINKVKVDFKNEYIVIREEIQDGDLFTACRSSVFISRSFMTMLLQFSTGLIYMGVTVDISIFSSNTLLSIFLQGLVETPGLFLSFFTLHYLKRKTSLMIFGTIGSTLMWISIFFNRTTYWQSIIRIIFGCTAKAIIASVSQSSLVYVSELYPTSHRSFAFVFVQLAAMMSFVGAIYINKLNNIFFFVPMTIYLILMLISCILTFKILPETKDLPLPETLDDQRALKTGHEQEFENYMKYKQIH